ncbi:MAG: hypothetical protein H6974_04495 [Gammaproteobacteria bacterium]|nr:hypothetical protein [Gammaproteobacteria bacterium]MCP5196041.1 hypothetical protein [Gammaproteobacteria bacterium]
MRKLMIIIATILVVLVLMAGSIWGYLWYSTRQQAEQLVAAAKPFAEVSYDGVYVLPTGSVGAQQVKIIPHLVNDVISIGAIRLNAPNILALLNIRRQLSQGQLPEALSLSLRRFELPLYGGIIGAKPPSPSERTPFDDLEALGCGPVIHFGGAEWEEMGYERFISNIEVGYRLDAPASRISVQISSNTQDWATLHLDIGFALDRPSTSIMELAQSLTPKLASLHAVLQDNGYNNRRNEYCAAKAGKPVNEYMADHVRLVVERLRANGIHLGPGLIAAYQRYLTKGERFTITANPSAPIDPAELLHYKAEDVVKLAGLTVKIDDQAVTDLSMEWNIAQVTQALGARPTPTVEKEPEEAVVSVAPKPVIVQKSFHPTPVGELGQHVGKIAKLQTSTGASYLGKLGSITKETVKITIRRSGGAATLSLRSKDITEAQVLY